jgi:hypothetical protein
MALVNMDAARSFDEPINRTNTMKPEIPFLKRVLNRIRYGLALQTVRGLFRRIGIEFSPFYLFQEGADFSVIPELKEKDPDYTIGLLEPEEMKMIGNVQKGLSDEKLTALLEAGAKCIAIKDKGEIVAFTWISFDEVSFYSTVMKLKNDEAYLWSMFTIESHRGKNLAPYLRYKSYEILKELGRNIIYSASDSFNSPAVRFKEKLNAKKLKLILFVKIFNRIQWSFTLKSYI